MSFRQSKVFSTLQTHKVDLGDGSVVPMCLDRTSALAGPISPAARVHCCGGLPTRAFTRKKKMAVGCVYILQLSQYGCSLNTALYQEEQASLEGQEGERKKDCGSFLQEGLV